MAKPKPMFDQVHPSNEGMAAFQLDGFGYVDQTGQFVIPYAYDHIGGGFSKEFTSVMKDGRRDVLGIHSDGAISFAHEWIKPLTNEDIVANIKKNMLAWDNIKEDNKTPDSVTTNLNLRSINGDLITWTSTDTSLISTAGVVTRPPNGAGNKSVVLTATITYHNASDQVTFNITVLERIATNAIASPKVAVFDKNTESADYKDISVTLTLNGRTLNNVTTFPDTLTAAQYTVSSNTYTFKKEYLAAMEVGIQSFIFEMDDGNNPNLTVTITDTTTVIDVNPPMADVLRYDDVFSTDWFYDAVEVVSDKNLMSGTQSRIFRETLIKSTQQPRNTQIEVEPA